ncbi:hypothetical protein GGQ22_18440 [Nocardioides sp. zg-579]|uniref:Uncharacterized protein n=1 Tax=Nocardioides marmotae TaxID=2663857 RepID=A0A6I3JGI2_9ACTN|nr:hypothetical protein [Nocardioides marmotae]MTB97053.1 hypothetical protein [Nocardioides marmotae]QKE00714.1 hypothetical protein HPC71_06205 [Nocardioides marmotae]
MAGAHAAALADALALVFSCHLAMRLRPGAADVPAAAARAVAAVLVDHPDRLGG